LQGFENCKAVWSVPAPLAVWAVYVRETDPTEGVDPIEWCLLAIGQVSSAAEAETCLCWYCLRWHKEDWYRMLKIGSGIEVLRHGTTDRLKRAIGIRLVIAGHIMPMTLLGRECPVLPAEVLFSDLEVRALTGYAKKTGHHQPDSVRACDWPPASASISITAMTHRPDIKLVGVA